MNAPTQTWQSFKQQAERARQTGKHPEAISFYSQALETHDLPWEALSAMLMARGDSQQMLGNSAGMDADLTHLSELARDKGDSKTLAEALAYQANELSFIGELERAASLGEMSLWVAQSAGLTKQAVLALCSLSQTQAVLFQFAEAQDNLKTALEIADPQDTLQQLNLLSATSRIAVRSSDFIKAGEAARQGLQLARATGQRMFEGLFLNYLNNSSNDLSIKRKYMDESLEVFRSLGARLYENAFLNNSTTWLGQLGLYQRALESARQTIENGRSMGQEYDVLYGLQNLEAARFELGDIEGAQETTEEGFRLSTKLNDHLLINVTLVNQVQCKLALGDVPAAAKIIKDLLDRSQVFPRHFQANLYALQAITARQLGDTPSVRGATLKALGSIQPEDFGNSEALPDETAWWCYRALSPKSASGKISKEAWRALDIGRQAVLVPLESMSDAGLRRGYLHRVRFRRLLLKEWLRQAPSHGVGQPGLAEFTRQVQRPGRLDDIFQRLLTVGVRLNAQHDAAKLPEQIIEEISELTGGERIALVLLDENGNRRQIKTQLPRPAYQILSGRVEPEPDEAAFLVEIEPYLEEAALIGQSFLRQQNQNGLLTDERSILVSTLKNQGRLLGIIYTDITGCFGRFEREDLNLLGVLANQSAVAVENVTWSLTLEKRVADRTSELQAANQNLAQRNNELSIINEIQQGLASKLDLQAIIDLVGEKVLKIFNAVGGRIGLYDSKSQLLNNLYNSLNGIRENEGITTLGPSLTSRVIETRQPLLIGTFEEALAMGSQVLIFGTEDDNEPDTQSTMFVPLLSGGEVTGVMNVSRFEKYSYTEDDLRLLQTLAASLSVALENARLFDETQRLFKAGQERVAELQIVNSIQQGLAAELDFQAIVDLVGDKLRQVFQTRDIAIRWLDEKDNLVHFLYEYEHGVRLVIPSTPPNPDGLFAKLIRTRQTQVWNTTAEGDVISSIMVPGTDSSKSGVALPIISSDRVLGSIQLENFEREHAFGESELRLLTTIAGSLGSALENARLFDETQRLLKETEQRAAELAVINRVQEGLASKLDMRAIYDLVGDKLCEVFDSQDLGIRLLNPVTGLVEYPYIRDHGQRLSMAPMPFMGVSKLEVVPTIAIRVGQRIVHEVLLLPPVRQAAGVAVSQRGKDFKVQPVGRGAQTLGHVENLGAGRQHAGRGAVDEDLQHTAGRGLRRERNDVRSQDEARCQSLVWHIEPVGEQAVPQGCDGSAQGNLLAVGPAHDPGDGAGRN